MTNSNPHVCPGPNYPEATTHVIPLMMAMLPGIDPNDMPKALLTFQFISTFCNLVPITDASSAPQFHSDLSEHERQICSQTTQFEEFVAQYLDRCFVVIENSTLTQTREENSGSDHRLGQAIRFGQ